MIKYTKEQIVEAFNKWNKGYIANPDEYSDEISAERSYAEQQAEYLIGLIHLENFRIVKKNRHNKVTVKDIDDTSRPTETPKPR